MREKFWQLALTELDAEEWDALCDGCGKCCLHKLEDEASGEVFYTRVACRLLDHDNCRCLSYADREQQVPDCLVLSLESLGDASWLPSTCAYRLRHEGQPLANWHPLISGRPESVHESGESIRGKVLGEDYVHPAGFEEHIIHWV